HAFATEEISLDGAERRELYLHTSPEFALKKLLAAGEERIVAFARVFRNRERTPLPHPRFVMLEWDRADESYDALMEDCTAILRLACAAAGNSRLRHRGVEVDPALEPEHLTVADAFTRHAGIDLLSTLAGDGSADRDALLAQVTHTGLHI